MLNIRSRFTDASPSDGRVPHLRAVSGTKWLLLATFLLCPIAPAKAEYRLQVGDIIEIAVARLPQLKQRVRIQIDGTITYPLLGTISVADLSPAAMQAKVQATLAAKVFRQIAPDGRENSVAIDPDEVTASIAEYRPVYVNGDIARPGEQVYRPLMTVRQAVALSGGYDVTRLRMNNPILETADLRGEYKSLWTEYAKEQAHVWRLNEELGQNASFDEKSLLDVPIARSTAQAIVKVETDTLKARQVDAQAERTFLQRGIAQADEQLQVLSEQEKSESEGVKADVEEYRRTRELYDRGTLPILRVIDARRAMLLSSTRKLQTTAHLMQTRRQRDDLTRQIERLDGQRRSDLLRELQDATLALNKIRFKLQSTREKLHYTTFARSQLVSGSGNKPAITIVRNGAKDVEQLVANEEFELQPGDVVEVALRNDHGAGESSSRDALTSRDLSTLQGKPEPREYARQQAQTPP